MTQASGRWARRLTRWGLLLAAVALLEGHVTVTPGEIAAGSSQRFVVRVPTERPEATVRVRIEFPAGLGAPRFQPKPGWTYEVERDATGLVTAVTWSGGQIGPDEFDEFVFTARAPATPGPVAFLAQQTYAGGEVVAWVDAAGGERPAPRVEVRDSAFVAAAGAPAAAVAPAAEAPAGAPASRGVDWTAVSALLVSVLALAVAFRARSAG